MQEKDYYFLRKLFFWVFASAFIIFTPILLFNSLGYKFDIETRKFLKTGAISIETNPEGASVYLNDKKLDKTTSCTLTQLLPKEYTVTLAKADFYPYQIPVAVKPAAVSDIDVVLIPIIKEMQKVKFNFNVYKFFISRHFFGKKIFAFTDKGIFIIDNDFKKSQRICSDNLTAEIANTIEKLIEANDRLMFWNKDTIWQTDISKISEKEAGLHIIYKAKESIKDAFPALKENYLIVHDGLNVVVLDLSNIPVSFPLLKLNDINSEIFYDSRTETLFVKEKVPQTNSSSLFKVDLLPSILERRENEKGF